MSSSTSLAFQIGVRSVTMVAAMLLLVDLRHPSWPDRFTVVVMSSQSVATSAVSRRAAHGSCPARIFAFRGENAVVGQPLLVITRSVMSGRSSLSTHTGT